MILTKQEILEIERTCTKECFKGCPCAFCSTIPNLIATIREKEREFDAAMKVIRATARRIRKPRETLK